MQQYLQFTVCAEGGETAEEQSDDEVRTSQVPERSEGKTKLMRKCYLPFTVLKLIEVLVKEILIIVVIVPTVYVCSKVWKTAEEQSDDEVRTSLT